MKQFSPAVLFVVYLLLLVVGLVAFAVAVSPVVSLVGLFAAFCGLVGVLFPALED